VLVCRAVERAACSQEDVAVAQLISWLGLPDIKRLRLARHQDVVHACRWCRRSSRRLVLQSMTVHAVANGVASRGVLTVSKGASLCL
jgi:hypothetical protein